jgi:hypothetical protein
MIHLKGATTFCIAIIISISFMACNNKQSDSRNIQLLTDSTAYQNNSSTDSAKQKNSEANKRTPARHNGSGTTESKSANNNSSGTESVSKSSSSTQGTEKKEGWSKAAQGAVIGGATGAVGGAIISKKKGTGAAVGAAVGAAGGYIIGREKDKKDGRTKTK